jgi:hypothetical protein
MKTIASNRTVISSGQIKSLIVATGHSMAIGIELFSLRPIGCKAKLPT